MRTGFKLLQVPGRYGYAVTLVGWLRRVNGDEYVMLPGTVSVTRISGRATLDELATRGLGKDHVASKPFKHAEEVHRLLVRRPRMADVKAWADVVPRPKDWRDDE